ncbi:MAG: LysM peptidoglycan-binding domain-containing protein [Gemmatimonadaceae bacterium]
MGLLDEVFDRDDDREKRERAKPRADFSDVVGESSSTAPSAPAQPVERERTHTVVAGDSLSKIAKREYGDANKWHAIFDANRDKIKNPDLIYPGQVLTLPPNA